MNKRVRSTDNIRPVNISMEIETVPSKRTKKYPSFCKNLKKYFKEYTENTSLHGVRYLAQYKRSRFERIYWMLVFIVSLFLCANLIIKTYNKWDRSPVIVSFAKSPTPVWQIPFPAITICPQMKARQSVFNFTDFYHKIVYDNENYTDEDKSNFEKVALLCDEHLYEVGNLTTEKDTIDYFIKVAPHFGDVLLMCTSRIFDQETCDEAFTTVLTQDGICYTFNMLDREDIFKDEVYNYNEHLHHWEDRSNWSLEIGYQNTPLNSSYPRRGLSSGKNAGFSILLGANTTDLDYICRGPVHGFKVLLHEPAEIPSEDTNFFTAPLNEDIIVAVKPDMMTTSESLRDYYPHSRHCYFGSERRLRFFKNYTQQNCEVECLTNYTLNKCDCVAFHMPHNESTPICGSGSMRCVIDASKQLVILQVESGINEYEASKDASDKKGCDCLPACSTLVYNTEITQLGFHLKSVFEAYKLNASTFEDIKMSRITIFFKEMQFITSERNELYGVTDFLASCGGLLGLFIGFSFISVVETFYFLTFRLMCNIRKYGKHYWSGASELIKDDAYIHNK